MKKNDIAAIILIVAFASIISWFAANAIVGSPQNNPVKVETVTPINPDFPVADTRIFNDKSIDPTVEISGTNQPADKPFTN